LIAGGATGFKGEEFGILNQDFFLVGERPLWVVCGLTISMIERLLFHIILQQVVRNTRIKL